MSKNILYPLLCLFLFLVLTSCTEKKMLKPVSMQGENAIPLPQDQKNHPLALQFLPNTKKGYTDWVTAIRKGIIKPKEQLMYGEDSLLGGEALKPMPVIDFDIYFRIKSNVPDVKFPHRPHTEWLDCRNCHPGIFLMKAGSNPITMEKILKGEFCGRCHGTVAFSLADCTRCHSIPK